MSPPSAQKKPGETAWQVRAARCRMRTVCSRFVRKTSCPIGKRNWLLSWMTRRRMFCCWRNEAVSSAPSAYGGSLPLTSFSFAGAGRFLRRNFGCQTSQGPAAGERPCLRRPSDGEGGGAFPLWSFTCPLLWTATTIRSKNRYKPTEYIQKGNPRLLRFKTERLPQQPGDSYYTIRKPPLGLMTCPVIKSAWLSARK